jgi:hypothetical protein
MMCFLHIDEFVIHVSISARSSRLCIPFSEKSDNSLDRLDNRHTTCGSQNDTLAGIKMTHITVAARCFPGYKYLLHHALIAISHSFFLSRFGFTFLTLRSRTMEDKRGTKHAHSPSKERSPSLSDAPTPPSAPSGSPPPLGSPPEVSSRRPRSPVFE